MTLLRLVVKPSIRPSTWFKLAGMGAINMNYLFYDHYQLMQTASDLMLSKCQAINKGQCDCKFEVIATRLQGVIGCLGVIWTPKTSKNTHQDTQKFLWGISRNIIPYTNYWIFSTKSNIWPYIRIAYLFWISKYMFKVVIWIYCGLPWKNGHSN